MKIKVLKTIGMLKAGGAIQIQPNQVNYFVGPNGSGKTVLLGSLAEYLKAKIDNYCWFSAPPKHILENFAFQGFEKIQRAYFFTNKTRQAQWVDMDYTLRTAASVGALHISEGRNSQIELVESFTKFKDDANSLVIFDEIDSNLDLKSKKVFWNHGLRQFKGTVIVVSHDPFYIFDEKVLDFSDLKLKDFKDYYSEQ